MTRDELAAMDDDEILAHYRRKHGNPYMPLSMAKEMHRFAFKYLHDTLRAEARRKGIPHCRRTIRPGRRESGVPSRSSPSTSGTDD
jgi:hypothetical protein